MQAVSGKSAKILLIHQTFRQRIQTVHDSKLESTILFRLFSSVYLSCCMKRYDMKRALRPTIMLPVAKVERVIKYRLRYLDNIIIIIPNL